MSRKSGIFLIFYGCPCVDAPWDSSVVVRVLTSGRLPLIVQDLKYELKLALRNLHNTLMYDDGVSDVRDGSNTPVNVNFSTVLKK